MKTLRHLTLQALCSLLWWIIRNATLAAYWWYRDPVILAKWKTLSARHPANDRLGQEIRQLITDLEDKQP